MRASPSHRRPLDPGGIGIDRDEMPPYGAGPIDVSGWFAVDGAAASRPLELEIGSGKGTFLVQQAAGEPAVNFIGLEYAAAYWRYAADRCRRHGLTNVRLVRIEAGCFLRWYAADGVFRQVHVYFPDPWPKKRHHKRRLIQEPILRELHRVLEPRGRLRIATDHAGYFGWICEHAEKVGDIFDQRLFDTAESAVCGEIVGTNFERKYRLEGRPIHATMLVRR